MAKSQTYNYQDGDVKLNFSFAENRPDINEDKKKFIGLLDKALYDLQAETGSYGTKPRTIVE